MKQGLAGVPTIEEFLKNNLKENDVLAFDGKVMSLAFVQKITKNLPFISIRDDVDFISEVWIDRPALPFSFLYKLEEFYSGKPFHEKLEDIRTIMHNHNLDTYILSSLEDQAWLYNLRANDILHTPVFLAFTIIENEACHLFIHTKKIDKIIEKYLKENNITLHEYDSFYTHLKGLEEKRILLDENKINYSIYTSIAKKNEIGRAHV